MAQVIPFKGLRYNLDKVGDIKAVTTPPYDVISTREQDEYYKISEYNCIRLELAKELPGDNSENNKYTRAAAILKKWIEEGVLMQEDKPSLYIYQQEFNLPDGRKYTRTGYIGLVRLEEFSKGVILPHENTLSKPKADRLNLMRACNANFSQIFALYNDPEKIIPSLLKDYTDKKEPIIATDSGIAGSPEKVWAVSDPSVLDIIQKAMSDKKLFIADGHHRYETALAYRDELKAQNPHHDGTELYNYVMMMLVEMEDPGLVILPTHRMVSGISGFDEEGFINKVCRHFSVEKVPFQGESFEKRCHEIQKVLQERGPHTFIYYNGDRKAFYAFTLNDIEPMEVLYPNRHKSYQELDVSILHSLILDPLLGIGEKELASQDHLTYTHDLDEGLKEVEEGKHQMVFFMNATTVQQIREVSLVGEKMPQKSTFFYPKLLTGLVFNKFR